MLKSLFGGNSVVWSDLLRVHTATTTTTTNLFAADKYISVIDTDINYTEILITIMFFHSEIDSKRQTQALAQEVSIVPMAGASMLAMPRTAGFLVHSAVRLLALAAINLVLLHVDLYAVLFCDGTHQYGVPVPFSAEGIFFSVFLICMECKFSAV